MDLHTKIVCTLGPASSSVDRIKSLIEAGMSVARLNFSHGSYSEHSQVIRNLKQAALELNRKIAVLQDLSGPKLRLGRFVDNTITLDAGANFTLTAEPVIGDRKIVTVNTPELIDSLKAGDRILLGDGIVELRVLSMGANTAYCQVIVGGLVGSNQGVTAPGVDIRIKVPTPKDYEDLAFGMEYGVDMVAQSFVRGAGELRELREQICKKHCSTMVIAKIEKREALENLDAILEAVDGVMVARGDLGLELGLAYVPVAQKQIIKKARAAGKFIITATQMLESMIINPRPTRAEASDVANAVFDGTDAVMLSGETAVGKYPAGACRMLGEVATATEASIDYFERFRKAQRAGGIPDAVAHAACQMALELDAEAIICCTRSGQTARHIAGYRPKAAVAVVSPDDETLEQSMVLWGTIPVKVPMAENTDALIAAAKQAVIEAGIAKEGARVIIVAGVPVSEPGTTNMIKADVL